MLHKYCIPEREKNSPPSVPIKCLICYENRLVYDYPWIVDAIATTAKTYGIRYSTAKYMYVIV